MRSHNACRALLVLTAQLTERARRLERSRRRRHPHQRQSLCALWTPA